MMYVIIGICVIIIIFTLAACKAAGRADDIIERNSDRF